MVMQYHLILELKEMIKIYSIKGLILHLVNISIWKNQVLSNMISLLKIIYNKGRFSVRMAVTDQHIQLTLLFGQSMVQYLQLDQIPMQMQWPIQVLGSVHKSISTFTEIQLIRLKTVERSRESHNHTPPIELLEMALTSTKRGLSKWLVLGVIISNQE